MSTGKIIKLRHRFYNLYTQKENKIWLSPQMQKTLQKVPDFFIMKTLKR